jgi:hypothetical protein
MYEAEHRGMRLLSDSGRFREFREMMWLLLSGTGGVRPYYKLEFTRLFDGILRRPPVSPGVLRDTFLLALSPGPLHSTYR